MISVFLVAGLFTRCGALLPSQQRVRRFTGGVRRGAYSGSSFAVEVVRRASPSVVRVRTAGPRGANSTGSGVVLEANWRGDVGGCDDNAAAWVLTNAHCVPPSMALECVLDGRAFRADLIGRSTVADVALLRVPACSAAPPLALALGRALFLGEYAVALGFASRDDDGGGDDDDGESGSSRGLLATRGVVSGLARSRGVEYVLTDALFRNGVSGGPLLDEQGECVGICTSVDRSGVGNAIAIDCALDEAKALYTAWRSTMSADRLEYAVYLYNDRFNTRQRVSDALATVFGNSTDAASLMTTAHETGRALCTVCDDAATAEILAQRMIALDLIAEVESRAAVVAA